MGRPRKSIKELELNGAFKKDPQRLRKRLETPKPAAGIGEPPDFLKPAQKAAWLEVVSICAPGLLKSSDRFALVDLSRLWAQYVKHGENTSGGMNHGVNSRQMSRLNKLLTQFGMTPLDRGKIHVPQDTKKANDPYAEFDKDNEFAEFADKEGQVN